MNAITLIAPKKSDLKIFAELAKKLNISARFVESSEIGEIEEVEDWELAEKMQKALKSGLADKNNVLKKLKIKTNAI